MQDWLDVDYKIEVQQDFLSMGGLQFISKSIPDLPDLLQSAGSCLRMMRTCLEITPMEGNTGFQTLEGQLLRKLLTQLKECLIRPNA